MQERHESLVWTIWTYKNTINEAELEKTVQGKVDISVRPLTSSADLQSQLEKSSLVIQDGRLSVHGGYCGVETLMCGVPTLIPDSPTQLCQILVSVNSTKASYFILPEEAEKWCSKILRILVDGHKAAQQAADLAQVLEATSKTTLQAFASWLGKCENCCKPI